MLSYHAIISRGKGNMTLRKVLDNGKPKICKCGHNIDQHIGQWYKKKACELCECDFFMRRERPTKSDWAIVGVEFAILGIILAGIAITPSDTLASMPPEVPLIFAFGIATLFYVCVLLIRQNLQMKKREVKTI